MPKIYDHGRIGSCTSNAMAAAVQYVRSKAGQLPDFPPSRLFIYYYGRAIENDLPVDAGLSGFSALTVLRRVGVCPENEWPYDDTPAGKNNLFPKNSKAIQQPSSAAINDAVPHRSLIAYSILQNEGELKRCLAQGYPFFFGFNVYPSFFDQSDPSQPNPPPKVVIPMPSTEEQNGDSDGHAVLAVGYDDEKRLFLCRNSWGERVQDKGYFYMYYDYVTNPQYADDFYTLRAVQSLL
jgi:C1A family cysteine protease